MKYIFKVEIYMIIIFICTFTISFSEDIPENCTINVHKEFPVSISINLNEEYEILRGIKIVVLFNEISINNYEIGLNDSILKKTNTLDYEYFDNFKDGKLSIAISAYGDLVSGKGKIISLNFNIDNNNFDIGTLSLIRFEINEKMEDDVGFQVNNCLCKNVQMKVKELVDTNGDNKQGLQEIINIYRCLVYDFKCNQTMEDLILLLQLVAGIKNI